MAVEELKVKHSRIVAQLESRLNYAIEDVYKQQYNQEAVIENIVAKSQAIMNFVN